MAATLFQKLQALSTKRILFSHNSVGEVICRGWSGGAGLWALIAANPGCGFTYRQDPANSAPANFPVGCFGDTPTVYGGQGDNGDPIGKINTFDYRVRTGFPGLDLYSFKFCFADFTDSTDVAAIWARYQTVMDALEVSFPGKILHWTVPVMADITDVDLNTKREQLSSLIRGKYASTGRLFDLADKEAHTSAGAFVTLGNVRALAPEWNQDGGHPNDAGSTMLATALVDFLYGVVTTSPMTTAHRTSGVAPLAVFFDAVDDVDSGSLQQGGGAPTFAWTSGVNQPSDREGALYSWDFGDPYGGTWTLTTGKDRNTATGYTAAHVFETPGTYTVTLDQTDTAGTLRRYTQEIVVTDPESQYATTTRYVASNGNDNNAGTLAAPYLTVAKAMGDVASGAAKRVLFRRGDTFAVSTYYNITAAGPGHIGQYGASGNRPVLNVTYNGESNAFSPRGTGTDWRFVDLEFHGPGGQYATGPVGPPNEPACADLLILRVKASSGTWNVSLGWGDSWAWGGAPPTYALHDRIFVVACEVPSPVAGGANTGTYCLYCGGRRVALLGNLATDSPASHVARLWMGHKAVVSQNHFLRCNTQRHELKIHGAPADGRPDTRWLSVTDNRFEGGSQSQWHLAIGPQDDVSNENISHLQIERNWIVSGPNSANSIEVNASYSIIRNNVFNFTPSASYGSAALIWRRGVEPLPQRVRAFNNTCYKTAGTSDTLMFQVNAGCTYVEVRNNLGVAWNSTTGWRTVQNASTTGWVESNNLLATQTAVTNAAGGDLTLAVGSTAIDTGVVLPAVVEDYARVTRAGRGSSYDVGAYESGLTASVATSNAGVSIRAPGATAITASVTVNGTATATAIGSLTVSTAASTPGSATATGSVAIGSPFTADASTSVSVEGGGLTATASGSVSVIAASILRIWGSDGGSNLTAETAIPIVLAPPCETHAAAGVHVTGLALGSATASASLTGSVSASSPGSVTIYGPTGLVTAAGSVSVIGSSSAAVPGSTSIQGASAQGATCSLTVGGTLTAGSPAGVSVAATRTAGVDGSVTINGTATAAAAGSVTVNDAGTESADATASVSLRTESTATATASVTVRLGSADSTAASLTIEGTREQGAPAGVSVTDSVAVSAEGSVVLASAGSRTVTASLALDWSSSATASVALASAYATTASVTRHYRTPATRIVMEEDEPMIGNFKIRVPYGTNFAHTLEFYESDRRTPRDVSGCSVTLSVAASAAGGDAFSVSTMPGAASNQRILLFSASDLPSKTARTARLIIDAGGATGPEDAAGGMLYAE